MARIDWRVSEFAKRKSDNYRNSDAFNSSRITPSKPGSDTHITNVAKKCYSRMLADPKNANVTPEVLWTKALTWARNTLTK